MLLAGLLIQQHASPLTTIIYTHPSDEERYAGVRDLPR